MTKNNSSRLCWMWESTKGTASISSATSESWFLGKYNESLRNVKIFDRSYVVNESYSYDDRKPSLINSNTKFGEFTMSFLPTTVWAIHAILGDAHYNPDTIQPLANNKIHKTLTIRHEENGGSHPFLMQAVGCMLVGLHGVSQRGDFTQFDATFAWEKYEDENTSGNEFLTTEPDYPGDIETVYQGQPEVRRDYGGANEAVINDIWKAEWNITINYKSILSADNTNQIIYDFEYQPAQLILYGIFEQGQESDDYFDRTTQDIAVKTYKPDGTNYFQLIFHNAKPVSRAKSGKIFNDFFQEVYTYSAEYVTVKFTSEGLGVDSFVKQYPEN